MMNRLQRKCLLGSLALHGLLLVILLVGPAFLGGPSKPPANLPVLHVIPSHLVDTEAFGGGNPRAQLPPPQPQPVTPAPTPQAPRSEPQPQPRSVTPEPEPVPPPTPPGRQTEPPRPTPTDLLTRRADTRATTAPTKPKIKVSNEVVRRESSSTARENRTAESRTAERARDTAAERRRAAARQAAAARKLEEALAGAARSLGENLSGATEIDIPGPGGAAYASYRQAVQSAFYDAWFPPDDVANDRLVVRAEIVVTRQGRIIGQKLIQRCGVSPVDHSVENALERVRVQGLPPFPEESTDLQRTFRINFNLHTKRMLG